MDRPALTPINIGTAGAHDFDDLNTDQTYDDQVNPFNSVLTAQLAPLGHPAGIDPQHFQLIASYENNPAAWLELPWAETCSGRPYELTSVREPTDTSVHVQTYRDVPQANEHHPEVKSAAANDAQADQRTVGLLRRLHVHELERVDIGRESNRLDDVDAGDVRALADVLTNYVGPGTGAFTSWVRPILRQMPLKATAERCRASMSNAHRVKSGRARIPEAAASRKHLALAAAADCGLSYEPTAPSWMSVGLSRKPRRTAYRHAVSPLVSAGRSRATSAAWPRSCP